MSTAKPLLTIIVPALNEAGVVTQTLGRIDSVVRTHLRQRGTVQVIVVSDGSTDGTFEEVEASLRARNGGVAIQLVRNVGSHAAIRCGMQYSEGRFVAVMAADGQDPPEALPAMLDAFGPGIDVVWGERSSRRADPRVRRGLARAYYWVFRRVTGLDYPPGGLDFMVVSERVKDALLGYRERNLSLFLLAYNIGYGQTSVPYERGDRAGGETKWSLGRRGKLAIDMLTAFSASPIRLVSALGIAVGLLGVTFGGLTLVRGLLAQTPTQGWASLMVISSLMGGLTLIGLALVGEYIWRALDEVRDRPLYLVRDHVTIQPEDEV